MMAEISKYPVNSAKNYFFSLFFFEKLVPLVFEVSMFAKIGKVILIFKVLVSKDKISKEKISKLFLIQLKYHFFKIKYRDHRQSL